MEKEIETFLGKVERTLLLTERLQADNVALKKRLAAVEAERNRLRQHMDAARVRVETLMEQIPEGA
jgi:cell division protein ZapB